MYINIHIYIYIYTHTSYRQSTCIYLYIHIYIYVSVCVYTIIYTRGYFLDGASALAAALLEPSPGASVLDLCAAPGGKSLMLASLLFAGLL